MNISGVRGQQCQIVAWVKFHFAQDIGQTILQSVHEGVLLIRIPLRIDLFVFDLLRRHSRQLRFPPLIHRRQCEAVREVPRQGDCDERERDVERSVEESAGEAFGKTSYVVGGLLT